MPRIVEMLGGAELAAYRDAIVTKKLAALALYRYATDWAAFLARLDADADRVLAELVA